MSLFCVSTSSVDLFSMAAKNVLFELSTLSDNFLLGDGRLLDQLFLHLNACLSNTVILEPGEDEAGKTLMVVLELGYNPIKGFNRVETS